MTTTFKGVVKGNVIELIDLKEALPYPEGTEVTVQVEPQVDSTAPTIDDVPPPSEEAWRKFEATIGMGKSGASDVGRNKHRYLAEAYDERSKQVEEKIGE